MTFTTGLLLLAAALAGANAPFYSRRILLLWRPPGHEQGKDKAGGWRVLELALLYFAVLGLARLLEANAGQVYPQRWEFYAVTVALFLVLAYPGFVYRYLVKRRKE